VVAEEEEEEDHVVDLSIEEEGRNGKEKNATAVSRIFQK
jgi:hypothetical protein